MLLRRRLMRRGRLLLRSAGRVIRVVRRRPWHRRVMRSRGSRRDLLAAARRRMVVHAASAAARDVVIACRWPGHGLRRRTRRNVGLWHLIIGRSTRRRWTGYVV